MSKTLARAFEFQHFWTLKFYTMHLLRRSSDSSKAERTPPFLFIRPIIWPRSNLDCQIRLNPSISQPPARAFPEENLAFWRYALYRHTFLFLLRNNKNTLTYNKMVQKQRIRPQDGGQAKGSQCQRHTYCCWEWGQFCLTFLFWIEHTHTRS